MRRLAGIGLSILFVLSSALDVTAAERRIALVIGNGRYEAVTRLDNPGRDAALVAQTLRTSGFDSVALHTDLTRERLVDALRRFASEAGEADWAVVYFAGHGIEANGMNYLVPIEARLASDRDLQFEGVPLDQVLASVEGARKLRLLILDACRDNPFVSQMRRTQATRSIGRGLAQIEPEGGTLVAYAAKHRELALDGTGDHSPFVTALVRHLPTPGLEINRLFRRVRSDVLAATDNRQQPFVYGSLPDEDFYFTPPLDRAPPGAAPPAGTMPPAAKEPGAAGESEGPAEESSKETAPAEGPPPGDQPQKPSLVVPAVPPAGSVPLRKNERASIEPPAIPPAGPRLRERRKTGARPNLPLPKASPERQEAVRPNRIVERPAGPRQRPAASVPGGRTHCFVFNGERVCE